MGFFKFLKKKSFLQKVDNAMKEEFYLKVEKYFENGLLREIYASDRISVCNAVNNCYIIFDYEMCKRFGTPYGIVAPQNILKSIMQDNMTFYGWLSNMTDKEIEKETVVCSDKVFEVMKQEKQRTDIEGPDINLDYEKMLIEKFGKNEREVL